MKKMLSVFMMAILFFALTGCGGNKDAQNTTSALQYKTYALTDAVQGDQKVIVGYTGDQVKSIEMQMKIPYSGTTKKEMEAALNQSIENFTKVEGTEARADYGTDEARLIVKMNLDKVSLDQLGDFGLNIADEEAVKAKALTLKTAETQLKEMGFEVQK